MPKFSAPQSKIKILHVTFNMGIGGTEQVIKQIIENSDTEKFIHEILCIDGFIGPIGQELMKKGINVESIEKKSGTDLSLIKFIRRLLKVRNINVLHCHQYSPFFYGSLGAVGTSTRVIFTEHGRFFPDQHNFKRRFINPILSKLSSHITAISHSTANSLETYEYIRKRKIKVIYNGIRDYEGQHHNRNKLLNDLNLPTDAHYIGTISRLEPIKNQAMMLNAFNMVKKYFPGLKIILIGDGAKKQDLQNLANSLGLKDDVIFTGFLDNPQHYISVFEIFLLSSFSEGTSMTLLEAMSLSRPCVVTDVGGNPEIVINGETGIVVPSDDVAAFSQSIISLLSDKGKSDLYGKAGRSRFIKQFTADHMINSYQLLYKDN